MTEFRENLKDIENYGKQLPAKEQAMRICISEATEIINTLFSLVVPVIDITEMQKLHHKIEAWEEQRDNL